MFLQVIQTDANKFFDIKRNALKCLTVIFRDFINYSRECINMILRPAWKLLNSHLPVFTEVQGYNQDLKQLAEKLKQEASDRDESEGEEQIYTPGYESEEDENIEEPHGIKGMTLQLIELLTTLVQRPNVQEVVKQGIFPLLSTVAGYMILEHSNQCEFMCDQHFFLHDKT